MMRTCDGTDPNLIGEDGEPCECGITFDDVRYMVIFPHLRVLTQEEKEALIEAWNTIKKAVVSAWSAVQDDFEEQA